MHTEKQDLLFELLDLANSYPSPHNGQPIRIKSVSDNKIELYFDKSRGLQAADVSFIFSFVSMGVFVEHLVQAARALGHEADVKTDLPLETDLRGEGLALFATCSIDWNAHSRDAESADIIKFRKTSRKKYSSGLSKAINESIIDLAESSNMELHKLSKSEAQETIWLNQRAVFDDMFDPGVNRELDHWLRYDKKQKEENRDGLAYDCMELNGNLIKFIVNHPGILRAPGISSILQKYYTRTMKDESDVYYMLAPFRDEPDSFNVGKVIMQIWLKITEDKAYIHPFGTIMSNKAAHKDFMKLTNVTNESKDNYLVFIFRAGHSAKPAESLRKLTKDHLLLEER